MKPRPSNLLDFIKLTSKENSLLGSPNIEHDAINI